LWSFLLLSSSLFPEPSYLEGEKEFRKAWKKLYPLPFSKITARDPQKRGVKTSPGPTYRYHFRIFVPKVEWENRETKELEAGREIEAFFFWSPKTQENPYRIHLGEEIYP